MTPITKELIFCRIEKLQEEKKELQKTIDHVILGNNRDHIDFIQMWEIDIQMMDLQIDALKTRLFNS